MIDGTIVGAAHGGNGATKQLICPMNKGNWLVLY